MTLIVSFTESWLMFLTLQLIRDDVIFKFQVDRYTISCFKHIVGAIICFTSYMLNLIQVIKYHFRRKVS